MEGTGEGLRRMWSNSKFYPVTRKFEERFLGTTYENERLYRVMRETIGEYEHGSADVTDVHPNLTVEMYADVCGDILECTHTIGETY